MTLIFYYKVREAELMKEKLRKEKKDHQAALSKVTILYAKAVELSKNEEVNLRVKKESDM